jgi:hypothetical protein
VNFLIERKNKIIAKLIFELRGRISTLKNAFVD